MSRRTSVILLFVALTAILLQISVIPIFIRSLFRPDLLLIIMVFIALRTDLQWGALAAWLLGIVNDSFGGLYLGLNAVSFLLSYMVIKSFSERVYADSANLFIIAVAGVTIAKIAVNMLLVAVFTAHPAASFSMLNNLLPHLLVNMFVASIVTAVLPMFKTEAETV